MGNEIKIEEQKPGEEKKYNIVFKGLERYPIGEYKSYYLVYINGTPLGEKLSLRIIIKEKIIVNELDEYMEKIKEFRENYELSENDYSDERIFEVLKENNFDFEASFSKIFD